MKTVIVTRGLPGSGKTFWSRQQMELNPGHYKLVCKDDLRAMLDNGRWSGKNESFVLQMRDDIIRSALVDGWSVIVADTNLNPTHIDHIRRLVHDHAESVGRVVVVIEDFTHIPIETCIAQDLMRLNSVGEKVIREQYEKWLKPAPAPAPEYIPGLVSAIVVDLDGTLALHNGRNPFDHSKLMGDTLNQTVYDIIRAKVSLEHLVSATEIAVLIVSGRDSIAREDTMSWLINNNVKYDYLWMRPEGDNRKDTIIKEEIYRREIEGKYNVLCVFDDRNQTVDLWRSLGFCTFQVNYGDF